jgi:hypothetical protein
MGAVILIGALADQLFGRRAPRGGAVPPARHQTSS